MFTFFKFRGGGKAVILLLRLRLRSPLFGCRGEGGRWGAAGRGAAGGRVWGGVK
jgi:hypothetical protein